MHKIFIFNLIVWSGFSVALNEASSKINSCKTANNESGFCVPQSDCVYLRNMTMNLQRNHDSRESSTMQGSQCGNDNAQTDMSKKVLVCCPVSQKMVGASVRIEPRFGNLNSDNIPGNILPRPNDCGIFVENRILSGNQTELNEFPWMALLLYKNSENNFVFLCGGSLINSRYVLTAAHCAKGNMLSNEWALSRVRLGEWDVDHNPDCVTNQRGVKECALEHVDIDVERAIVHELYDQNSTHQLYDIALLRLASAVSYNLFVKPICLPLTQELRNTNLERRTMVVAGWGQTKTKGYSPIKLKVNLMGWSLRDCLQKYKMYNFYLNETQICAGGENDIDTCGGDSGGPLMMKEKIGQKNVYFATGIVSYGQNPCGTKGWPSVNTNVGSFVDWIQNNLEP